MCSLQTFHALQRNESILRFVRGRLIAIVVLSILAAEAVTAERVPPY
jgi:hypothetical protein